MNLQRFEILILGCSSASPVRDRFPSSQVINIHEKLFLLDCGEGTQMRFIEYKVKKSRIQHIFISHLHGDHVFGLPGLLTSMSHAGRKDELHVYGPMGLREFIETVLSLSGSHLSFELQIHEYQDKRSEKVFEDDSIIIQSIPLKHRLPTIGYLFREKKKPPHLDHEKLIKKNIPEHFYQKIKQGENYIDEYGNIYQANEFYIEKNTDKERSYAYCSDTVLLHSNKSLLQDVNVLYHETTYLDELLEKALETGHSTALQAAQLAKEVNAKMLITGHYSSRYEDLNVITDECKTVFENVVLGMEGLRIDVPFDSKR